MTVPLCDGPAWTGANPQTEHNSLFGRACPWLSKPRRKYLSTRTRLCFCEPSPMKLYISTGGRAKCVTEPVVPVGSRVPTDGVIARALTIQSASKTHPLQNDDDDNSKLMYTWAIKPVRTLARPCRRLALLIDSLPIPQRDRMLSPL